MIEVHKDYNGIDAENRRLFEKHGTKSNAMMYRCVICGTATCIDGSISDMGHNLVCLQCVHDKNKFPNWYVDAFDWIHADTGRSRGRVTVQLGGEDGNIKLHNNS